jgi:murein L,D-transpeptidase YafK
VKRTAIVTGVVVLAFAAVIWWAQGAEPPLPDGTRADLVVVKKGARMLELYRGPELLRTYDVSLGPHPDGPKSREGDGRTPEGRYAIDYRKTDSSFHRALHITYPSAADIAAASSQGGRPGGLIMIHGLRNGLGIVGRLHTLIDWTDGCVAVTNTEIEEIWRVVPDGTPIVIWP